MESRPDRIRLGNGIKPDLGALGHLPWWGWLGGVCGVIYVTAVFTAIAVTGQQLAVFFDRYALMPLPQRPVTLPRLAGVALLPAHVASIQVV